MVVSAPTGSGKTVLFELCILRLLSRFLTPEWRFSLVKGTLKTVCADYLFSNKAGLILGVEDTNHHFTLCFIWVAWLDIYRSHEGVGAGEDAGLDCEAGRVGDQLLGDDW
jgi:hypothetical protein